jgi:phosphopantetheine--protein transferase-like protein
MFTEHELNQAHTLQSLAGRFAVKEAVIKALDLMPGCWLEIEISNSSTGKPTVRVAQNKYILANSEISISHDGEYVMAVAIFMIE